MSVNVGQIQQVIETLYPPEYACEWDNSGFQLNLNNSTNCVLVCLDVTPEIIREAAGLGCWLIVSHHPLLFRAVNMLDTRRYIDRCIADMVKCGISLYSAHTTADNAPDGINARLAGILGLADTRFLEPLVHEAYYKVAVSVPPENAEDVKRAMAEAGAGRLGNYSGCNFSVRGMGEFVPDERATPHIGEAGRKEVLEEIWIQALAGAPVLDGVLRAIRAAHPYEEPAIDVFLLRGLGGAKAGMGIVGDLEKRQRAGDIINKLKDKLALETVRLRGGQEDEISRIAICGGAGGDLLGAAAAAGAQLFITGEMKHNHYVESPIDVMELGHYESEKCFCGMMADSLQKALIDVNYNITVRVAEKMEKPYFDY